MLVSRGDSGEGVVMCAGDVVVVVYGVGGDVG